MSKGEAIFEAQLKSEGIAGYEREVRFFPKRRWRFDFAWSSLRVAVEIEGGIHSGGRHTRGSGYQGDLHKYNAAVLSGWKVLRFSTSDVTEGTAIRTLAAFLAECQNVPAA